MIQIALDCYRIAAPQLKFYIRDYGKQKQCRRRKKADNNLQSLWDTLEAPPSVKEEERKSHFLNVGQSASGL